jgi:hypothetical protein
MLHLGDASNTCGEEQEGMEGRSGFLGLSAENYSQRPECGSIFS